MSALANRQYPEPTVKGENRRVKRETFDHLIAQAVFAHGGTPNAEIVGSVPTKATPFRLEVTGDNGEMALVGGAPRGFQSGQMKLILNGAEHPVDEGELVGLADAAVNVGGIYAALRDDIANGTSEAPDFTHAVRLTRLMDDLLASSAEGRRRDANEWPRL